MNMNKTKNQPAKNTLEEKEFILGPSMLNIMQIFLFIIYFLFPWLI